MAERRRAMKKVGPTRDAFALLLKGFALGAAQDRASTAGHTDRMRALLTQFGEIRSRADASAQAQAAEDRGRIGALLTGYNEAVEHYCRQQEQDADDFNLLEVMRLTGKEIHHSMVLAWLLDHDLRKLGTHAQEKLGFRLFLKEFR